jgi:excisionase family DNA binding protein
MSGPTRHNSPHPGAASRYGPTPAAPGGGAGRRPPAVATHAEARPCPHGDPGSRACVQPDPPPRTPENPGGQPRPVDPLARLPEVLKVGEAAAILRVGRNQLYEAVARGELSAVRIGRTIRIPKAALADLLTPHT